METSHQQPSLTPVSEVGEFGLIARMRAVLDAHREETAPEDVLSGIADDAAVYRVGEGRVHVLTTDALVEGIHFDRAFMPMEHLGVKALAVNVSDVAAMNARPRYATLALGLPQHVYVEHVEQLYRGLQRACRQYGVTIIGGDTVSAGRLTLSVTVVGEAEEEDIAYRKGARPGDALCVTGDLGAAYAGLKVLAAQRRRLQEEGEAFQPEVGAFARVIQRQLAPTARLDVIEDWAERGVRPHALIDISDGLASEVHHLCEAGGVGARLFGAALPVALETRRAADRFGDDVDVYALFGGEDYELLFALPPEQLGTLDEASFTVVGEVTEPGEGVQIKTPEGELVGLRPGGYEHFGGEEEDAGE